MRQDPPSPSSSGPLRSATHSCEQAGSFREEAFRGFVRHFIALLEQEKVPMDKVLLSQTLAPVQPVLDPGAVVRRVEELLAEALKELPARTEALAARVSERFASEIHGLFCLSVGRYLEALGWRQPVGQSLEAESMALAQVVERLLFPMVRREAAGRVAQEAAQGTRPAGPAPGAAHEPAPAPPPPAHPLLDAFGRALFTPVEAHYPIRGQEESVRRGQPAFPRPFCAPALAEIKFRLIGGDKYDATNEKFIASIRKHCHVEGQLDPARLKEYFQHETVRQYLIAYCLHLLKALMPEERKETFLANVNARIQKHSQEPIREFLPMHLAMLTTGWALYVFDHLADARSSGTVSGVLRHYIPGRMSGRAD